MKSLLNTNTSIVFENHHSSSFLNELSEYLQIDQQSRYVHQFENSHGKGQILFIEIEKGFEVELLQLHLNEDLHVQPIPSEENTRWNVSICNDYIYAKELSELTPNNYPYCVVLSSSSASNTRVFPANCPIFSFSLTFSKNWIEANIIQDLKEDPAERLNEIIQTNEPVFMIDNIDIDLHRIVDTLLNEDIYQQNTKLLFYRTALDLTLMFFKKLINKSIFIPTNQHFKKRDIQKIHEINEVILADLSKPCPSIEELSKSVGMSTAKFKTLYKAIFNNSVYNYHLNERLVQARKFLQSGKYTINEVAYMVGFNYPSSFSRIFKKTFGQSPLQFMGLHYEEGQEE